MSNHQAIRQLIDHAEKAPNYTREERIRAAQELAEWHLLSNRQIARLVRLQPQDVAPFTGKTDSTGGTLSIESLPLILRLIELRARGEMDAMLVADTVDAGASTVMIARLVGGRTERTFARYAARGRALREERAS